MSIRAEGMFEVTSQREPPYDTADGVVLGRTSLTKQFTGGLDATSTVQMLAAGTPVPGSAGYVALERVSGRLAGRSGSFVLQHTGWMRGEETHLAVTVVPDSGTGELKGISGQMTIQIADGKHHYTFEYLLERA